jgi:Rrf2 family cysteine metabolism transcriptional repressor
MVSLSRAAAGEHISARAMAAEQAIPAAILPQVMSDLVRASLVVPLIGRTGGYRLARPAAEISVFDIVTAVEGPDQDRGCILRNAACLSGGECVAHEVMAGAQAALVDRLRASSLATLVEG